MVKKMLTTLMALALSVTPCCSRGGAAVPDASNPEQGWTRQGNLEVRLEVPAGPHKAGDEVVCKLHFRNPGKEPVRIYMLMAEPFRYGQSEFTLETAAAAKGPPLPQPQPRPHGCKVTAADFHLIEPGQSKTFSQALRLDKRVVTGPGKVGVTWTYRNKITRWEGGRQTLDGPTEDLFPGGDIPHIWTGEVKVKAELLVAAD